MSAREVEWAKRVVAVFAHSPGAGVLTLDGKMPDRPCPLLARRLFERAR